MGEPQGMRMKESDAQNPERPSKVGAEAESQRDREEGNIIAKLMVVVASEPQIIFEDLVP